LRENREPTEEELERSILRALSGLSRAIERYIQRRRESKIDGKSVSGIAEKAAPEHR
jgi:hypothetical protein